MAPQKISLEILTRLILFFAGSFQEDEVGKNCSFQVVCIYNKASILPWAFYCLDLSLTKDSYTEPLKGKYHDGDFWLLLSLWLLFSRSGINQLSVSAADQNHMPLSCWRKILIHFPTDISSAITSKSIIFKQKFSFKNQHIEVKFAISVFFFYLFLLLSSCLVTAKKGWNTCNAV